MTKVDLSAAKLKIYQTDSTKNSLTRSKYEMWF